MSRPPNHDRRRFLSAAAAFACAGRLGVFASAIAETACAAATPAAGRNMPSLGGATGWLNSPPLTTAELRGRVVLVDFWTYSCINWLRTLPHVRAWAAKYREQGLVVIGVHSPEFGFEKAEENVRRAVRDMRIEYPVAIDSDHAVWNAFDNAYWPALYLVDAHGRVRYSHPGEGAYEQSERTIQTLLTEAGATGVADDLVRVAGQGAEADADWRSLRTPETYVGSARGERRVDPAPERLALNEWALVGSWTVGAESAVSDAPNGRIVYRFHARDVHLVMGARAGGASVRYRIRIDGQAPGDAHGTDVDAEGAGTVSEPRLYQLVRQTRSVSDREIEIEFLDPGAEAFAFTFG